MTEIKKHYRTAPVEPIGEDQVLYLSGPMSGYDEYNFPAFEEAATKLRARGVNILSAHEVEHPGDGAAGSLPWAEYLRVDIATMLLQANAIILLPLWYSSKGAQLEMFVAHQLGWPIYFYREGNIEDREGRVVLYG